MISSPGADTRVGDRAFSGIYDYEIAIGVPEKLVFDVSANLFLTGGRLNMGKPWEDAVTPEPNGEQNSCRKKLTRIKINF